MSYMSQRRQELKACMIVLLLLSAHPLKAARIAELQWAQNSSYMHKDHHKSESNVLVHQLARVAKGQTKEEHVIHESSCSQLKHGFERRVSKVQSKYEEAKTIADSEKIKAHDAAWVILKVHGVVKQLVAAEQKKCNWIGKNNVDTSVLKQLMFETAGRTACFNATLGFLQAAHSAPAEEQGRVFSSAVGIFLSSDCKPHAMHHVPILDVDAAISEEEKETDAYAKKLTEATNLNAQSSALMQHNVLVNAEVISNVDSFDVGDFLGRIIAFLILSILWSIFCWVFLKIVKAILGMILCLLKIIIVAFLRLFGSKRWDFDYGKCVAWWTSDSWLDGFHVSSCAANAAYETLSR